MALKNKNYKTYRYDCFHANGLESKILTKREAVNRKLGFISRLPCLTQFPIKIMNIEFCFISLVESFDHIRSKQYGTSYESVLHL